MTKPSPPKPVLNIFAGPNGSGKSTIIAGFLADSEDLGVLVNADQDARQAPAFRPGKDSAVMVATQRREHNEFASHTA